MITFDTGALIALERNKPRVVQIFQTVVRRGDDITVPAAVITEWWRGRTDVREDILESVVVELLTPSIAKAAGEAIADTVRGATAIDAILMASAARRGDVVLTSDVQDLERLRPFFPSVRVLGV